MSAEVSVIRWQAAHPPDADQLLARLRATGRAYATWDNAAGDTYAVHTHAYAKHLVCLSGDIRFILPATGEHVDLGPGDELELPPGTSHGAIVGPRGVRCAETHH